MMQSIIDFLLSLTSTRNLFFITVFFVYIAVIVSIIIFTGEKFQYKDKHVVVTGGSSGIGLHVAKEYLQRGANVTIVGRDKRKLTNAIIELQNFCKLPSQKIIPCSLDVSSNEETVAVSLNECVSELGPIDVLVNCAGSSIAGKFESLKSTDFEEMLRTNVLGSIYPTRFVIPQMKLRKSGRIVFVSSQVAHVAIYGYTAYGASKWALRGLGEALQMECKPYNIYVSICYPPDTDTPGYQHEMLTKPNITKKLSESGSVFSTEVVAKKLVNGSTKGLFTITIGLDGWLLKQLHPGMSPLNNFWEVLEPILFSPLARIISLFYLYFWDVDVKRYELDMTRECKENTVDSKNK